MRSSVTSMRCACATARLYSVFLTDRISASSASFKALAGATTFRSGAIVSLVGAIALLVGADLLAVGAGLLLVGAIALLAGASLPLDAGGPPPWSKSTSGTSLRRCIHR